MCWDRFVNHQMGLDSQYDSRYVQYVQLIRTAIALHAALLRLAPTGHKTTIRVRPGRPARPWVC